MKALIFLARLAAGPLWGGGAGCRGLLDAIERV